MKPGNDELHSGLFVKMIFSYVWPKIFGQKYWKILEETWNPDKTRFVAVNSN